jgi:stage V sporulation protein R
MRDDRIDARREASRLSEPVERAAALAEKLGLEPYPVNYWIVDHDEMNELIAYGGFQRRYPHWRWGMAYDRQQKQDQFGMGKAFEIVNNDNPAHAFLQESNSLADQKAVITHVEAHADFFANNEWFGLFGDGDGDEHTTPDAAAMLERHAETIAGYVEDPDIDREAVERFIDAVLCLEDTIDQHRAFARDDDRRERDDPADLRERLADLDLSEEVRRHAFDDEWLADVDETERASTLAAPHTDVLAYLRDHGRQYDPETDKAVPFEPWQREVLDILRTESYYFAGQKMTKVLNEGWAAFWESVMMSGERFADTDEFVTYADHMARVLGSPGLNPYKLGKELWAYVENLTNRKEVVDHLLRVEGITWRNFHDAVDFEAVADLLAPDPAVASVTPETLSELDPDDPRVDAAALERARAGDVDVDRYPWTVLTTAGLAERHFSLCRPQNRGFLERIRRSDLERLARYMFDDERYETVADAVEAVDYGAGWRRMRELRESHNDVTFIDAFLSEEFVTENHYFTYEFSETTGDFRVASPDAADVKRKLLLQFTNFGKPTVAVFDGNFDNRNELLLGHRYNGIQLDVEQAKRVLERVHDLWGRPVNLMTIVKEYDDQELNVARQRRREPEPTEVGKRIRYDGSRFETHDLDPDLEERIAASDVDYDTKPDDWLS